MPSGRFPNHEHHAFQPSAWAAARRSILGPVVPTMIGGPFGRGPRGTSTQSRARW